MRKSSEPEFLKSVRQNIPPAFMSSVMTECISPCSHSPLLSPLSLRLCPCAGAGSQRGHGLRRGRAAGGDVLREAQHARQHSDRPLGARPVRNQELRRNQRGRAAVLPGGESRRDRRSRYHRGGEI